MQALPQALEGAGLEIGGVRTRRLGTARYEVDISVRHATDPNLYAAVAVVGGISGVTVVGVDQGE